MAVGLKRRIRILEELEVLLQRLYGEMEYAGNDMIDILKILQVESIYFSELWQRIIERLERILCGYGKCGEKKLSVKPVFHLSVFWDRKNNIFCRRWDVH